LAQEWKKAKSKKDGKAYFKQLDSEVSNIEGKMQALLKKFEAAHPLYKVRYTRIYVQT
jgi:hypothetical protein